MNSNVPQRLRAYADWLERHNVQPDELNSVSVGARTGDDVLLHFKGGERICRGRKVRFVDGFGYLEFDGVNVCIIEPVREKQSVEIELGLVGVEAGELVEAMGAGEEVRQ